MAQTIFHIFPIQKLSNLDPQAPDYMQGNAPNLDYPTLPDR